MFLRTRPDLAWHFERRKASKRYYPKMKSRIVNVSPDCDDPLRIFDTEDECFGVEYLLCNPLRVESSPYTAGVGHPLSFCTFVIAREPKVCEFDVEPRC